MPGKYTRHAVFTPDIFKHYHDHPENLHKFNFPMDHEEVQYTIKRITDHRNTKNGKQYLVHWKGNDEDENTWELVKIIEKEVPEAVKDYQEVLVELGESPMDMDSEYDFLYQTILFILKVLCLSVRRISFVGTALRAVGLRGNQTFVFGVTPSSVNYPYRWLTKV